MNTRSQKKHPGRRSVLRIPAQPGIGENKKSNGDADVTGDTAEGEGESGDVPGYVLTSEDLRLREVYRDWVHRIPGTHLDGGVKDKSAWLEGL